jgi:hypothetical protein
MTTAWGQSSRLNDKTAIATPLTTEEENVEVQEYLFLAQPCNHGCEGGEFEIGSVDYGYVVRHACNWAPNLGQLDPPVMNRVCFRTNNNTGDIYWWSVNQLNALTSCSGLGSTGVPCVSYINFTSTPDLITTATVPTTDIDWSTDAVGNPDFTWDPLNQDNNHYVRLVH